MIGALIWLVVCKYLFSQEKLKLYGNEMTTLVKNYKHVKHKLEKLKTICVVRLKPDSTPLS